MNRWAGRRLALLLLVLPASVAGCSDDDGGGPRAFDLEVLPYNPDSPLEPPDLADEWGNVQVEIVEAPSEVTAGGDDFSLVLEMHNTLDEAITLEPCPVWEAGMGESGEVSSVEGVLPCDEIGSLGPGERIRLRMEMPPTERAVSSQSCEIGVGLGWRVKGEFFQETQAAVCFEMNGPR